MSGEEGYPGDEQKVFRAAQTTLAVRQGLWWPSEVSCLPLEDAVAFWASQEDWDHLMMAQASQWSLVFDEDR